MKTKILLLTVLGVASVAFAQQSSVKTAAKEAIVEAIANRPAPGASRGTKKVGVSETTESKGPRLPL